MSGRVQRATAPLMSMEEASQRFDQLVYDGVYELLDLHGLLELEQGLWQALFDCGVSRLEAPRISAQLIARALTRIGEAHVALAAKVEKEEQLPPQPVRRAKA